MHNVQSKTFADLTSEQGVVLYLLRYTSMLCLILECFISLLYISLYHSNAFYSNGPTGVNATDICLIVKVDQKQVKSAQIEE